MSGKFVIGPLSGQSLPAASADARDTSFASKCPALWEYLSLTQWSDGSSREPASLILLVEDGRWKACLSDKANARVGWRTGDTLAGLLEALEVALEGDSLDWRRAKPPSGRRGR